MGFFVIIGRPTYLSADLCFTGILLSFFFLLLFLATYPPSSLNETQRKSVTWSEVSAIWKCMSEIWGQNTFFRWLRNSAATLVAYIFGMKHDIDNRVSALITTRGLLYRLKMPWTLVQKRIQIGPPFSPHYVNSAFYFIARLCRRTSANETQPYFAKRSTVNRANNLP